MASEIFSCSQKQKRTLLSKKIAIFSVVLLIFLTLIYNFQILPVLIPLAKSRAATEITANVQSIIKEHAKSNEYKSFVKLNYGSDKSVVSLETNTAAISAEASSIAEDVTASLVKDIKTTVSIPIGNLSGTPLLMGRGPNVNIKFALTKRVTCEIENEFYESGINQTLHRIVAKIYTDVYVLLPFFAEDTTVVTEYILAETIIVGKVPDAYTKINRLSEDDDFEESDIDDIFDFGATLN